MSRDQRVEDNWALIYAQELALELKSPLIVIFCLVDNFLGATIRHYGFMLKGLSQVESSLKKLNIPFILLKGEPAIEIPKLIANLKAGAIVTDFDPLKIKRNWKQAVIEKIKVAFMEVDAHNIVPCYIASTKQEFAARTFRPKINKLLPKFLDNFRPIIKHPFTFPGIGLDIEWQETENNLKVDRCVDQIEWLKPGESSALKHMRNFIANKLKDYDLNRNDPILNGQSNLSPYLHFGQISAQRVALEIINQPIDETSKNSFLEELIVRRELSDNFCHYNLNYDTTEAFPAWAKKSLENHIYDKREYIYTLEQFANALTHDDLWNAAQLEMVKYGKINGYLRMYWAKKILEWTESPEKAIGVAISLNDKYQLDGRDPNGYTGIAWSIGGVHDRPWNERPVFGKIRYMNYNGCKRKFNVAKYIEKVNES
jgi:deoxyribodipyrimidine photo-lyase